MTVESTFSSAVTRAGFVVQPRMGFSDPDQMARGLRAVRAAKAPTVGTITLDSYTRTGQYDAARRALDNGFALNGYPLVTHGPCTTAELIAEFDPAVFPIQVRHGSTRPLRIFRTMLEAGLTATEGGPVSYCLPYGRTPLATALDEWARSCELFAAHRETVHLESFAGCMLGQLCPPSLLVALNILEGLFFTAHGVRSISLSYAQQTNFAQDVAAVRALKRLADRWLPDVDRHVVVYTYMGVYPRTIAGARALLEQSALLARTTGAQRLVVKTTAEAKRIPAIEDNVAALETAATTPFEHPRPDLDDDGEADAIHDEALTLVEVVLELRSSVAAAIGEAFRRGLLDVPFCVHPDNANRTRTRIDETGRLCWADSGGMAISPARRTGPVRAHQLLSMLSYMRHRFDGVT